MTKFLVRYSLPISLLGFSFLFIALFPLYKFVFDDDSIGYAAVTERIVRGDYYRSINAIWSPLSSWLAVPLLKMGIAPIYGFKYNNGITGLLLLISIWQLLKKINILEYLKATILNTCVPVLLSFCFYELCADFLLLLFFTQYLIQLCSDDFFYNYKRQLLAVIFAALAYLSKAYFFPFFLIHFIIVNYYCFRNSSAIDRIKIFFRNLVVGITGFLFLCAPWLIMLYSKYHYFTISNAGKYNSYAYLHSNLGAESSKILIPFPYPDSYSDWEYPFYPCMKNFSVFSSFKNIGLQIKLAVHNIFYSVSYFTDISVFGFFILAAVLILFYNKKWNIKVPANIMILTITALIFPTGYFLFFFDHRYIWILSILYLIMGAYLLNLFFSNKSTSKKTQWIILFIFVFSFILYPIKSLKDGIYNGKTEFEIATKINESHFSGNFIANYLTSDQHCALKVATVLSRNKFYSYGRFDFSKSDLQNAIKEFGIDYYLFSYTNNFEKDLFLSSDFCKEGKLVVPDFYPGIVLLKLK